MKLLRPRFTVRGLMIFVAITGIGLGIEQLRRRSHTFDAIARFHQSERCKQEQHIQKAELSYRKKFFLGYYPDVRIDQIDQEIVKARLLWPGVRAAMKRDPSTCLFGEDLFAYLSGKSSERIAYHTQMVRIYKRAARNPWLMVGPEPPEPE